MTSRAKPKAGLGCDNSIVSQYITILYTTICIVNSSPKIKIQVYRVLVSELHIVDIMYNNAIGEYLWLLIMPNVMLPVKSGLHYGIDRVQAYPSKIILFSASESWIFLFWCL